MTMMNSISTITVIGAGRVGSALARRFRAVGMEVVEVYSRTAQRAARLAEATGAQPLTHLKRLAPADLYLIAVPDDAIAGTARRLRTVLPAAARVVHCSGATPSAVLTAHFNRGGVFYPLQSFAPDRPLDWTTLPLCVHAQDAGTEDALEQLARQLSPVVHRVDDEQRAALHVAAVLVNNFTNYLFRAAEDVTAAHGLPFAILRPLIEETVARLGSAPARELQTGPAVRGDQRTIDRHLALLAKFPEYQRVYALLTDQLSS